MVEGYQAVAQAAQGTSICEDDAAAVVSVVEPISAGGKLSARAVTAAGQTVVSSLANGLIDVYWALPVHAAPTSGAASSGNLPCVGPYMQPQAVDTQQPPPQQNAVTLQLSSSGRSAAQEHRVLGSLQDTACPAPAQAQCVAHGGLKHDAWQPKQQHVSWDPTAVFLPGTYEVAAEECSSSSILPSPPGQTEAAYNFQPLDDEGDRENEQHLHIPGHSRSSNPAMRISNSCGCLNMLEGQAGNSSMGASAAAAKSRLGRVTTSAARTGEYESAAAAADSAAAGPDGLPAGIEGSVPAWLGSQPGFRMRSVTGGVGDEHSGTGQWHSSNWALERSASNCSFGTDDGAARKLHIHCVTFNMGSKVPSTLPSSLLGPPVASSNGSHWHTSSAAAGTDVDLYVFATQESGNVSDWERLIASSLPAGVGYERLAWQTLRGMHLVLYAAPRFRKQVLGVKGSAVATGVGNLVGNKGAVALAIQLIDMKLLFVGSHFAAHDDKVDRRNADFARIRTGLFSSSSYSSLADHAGRSGSISGASSQRSNSGSPAVFGSLARTAPGSGSTSGIFGLPPEVQGEDQQQQRTAGSLRADVAASASSASPRGWFSGLWSRCTTPANSTTSCNGSETGRTLLDASMCSGSHSTLVNQDAVMDAACEVSKLRASSCPSLPGDAFSSLGEPPCISSRVQAQQQTVVCDQHHCGTLDNAGGEAGADFSGRHSCRAHDHMHMSGPSDAAVCPAASSVSLADELKSQLSFFKSFNLSRPTTDMLRATRDLNTCGDITADYDVIFWAGDLNYRINGNTKAVGYLLHSKLYEVLHANDQLMLQQKKGRVFQGFQEGKIHFPPTFKYIPGTCDYTQQRVPSWTDRILWKVRQREAWEDGMTPTVLQNYYTSVAEVLSSDHKPVVAGFDLVMAAAEGPSLQPDSGGLRTKCSIM